jgi:signal transduction histidine kinase
VQPARRHSAGRRRSGRHQESDPETARGALENIAASSRHALSELRATLRVVRGGETGAEREPARGLVDLDALLAPARAAGLAVELHVDTDIEATPAYVGASSYRIVQEAVTNTLRHAQASSLWVRVTVAGDALRIEITDDGIGSDESERPVGTAEGHGLAGMRERVAALGGTCSAGARPEGGFLVTASIPLTGDGREAP